MSCAGTSNMFLSPRLPSASSLHLEPSKMDDIGTGSVGWLEGSLLLPSLTSHDRLEICSDKKKTLNRK